MDKRSDGQPRSFYVAQSQPTRIYNIVSPAGSRRQFRLVEVFQLAGCQLSAAPVDAVLNLYLPLRVMSVKNLGALILVWARRAECC